MTRQPFSFSDEILLDTTDKTLNFFHGQRSGFEVTGINGVCHQDLQGEHAGERRVIKGGWHNADNQCQGVHQTELAVFALLRV